MDTVRSADANNLGLLLAVLAPVAVLSTAIGIFDLQAGLIIFGAMVVPFLTYAGYKGILGETSFGTVLAVALIFVLCANFRYREYGEKSIDFQVALKLLAIMAVMAISAFSFKQIVNRLYLYGLFYWYLFLGFLVISSLYSMAPAHSLTSTVSLIGGFTFLCYCCVKFGSEQTIKIVVWSGMVMAVVSLVVYILFPSFGRMSDWYGNEFVVTSRLQGIYGSSNGAGSSAATGAFLAMTFYAKQKSASRLVLYGGTLAMLLCMVLSNNRMAVIALGVSVGLNYILAKDFGKRLLVSLAFLMVAVCLLILFQEEIFSLVSRSGDSEEITSATGRTRIWPVVIDLWYRSPIIGWGFSSAQHILPIHPDLFLAAAHAHNVYLEILFSTGIIGFGLFIWCILTTIVLCIRIGARRELSLFAFFMVYGLTEPLLNGPISYPIFAWFLIVVLLFHKAKTVMDGAEEPTIDLPRLPHLRLLRPN
ncbi:O-antigen ligase family protein [Bosea sp. PAMC 26642]|uniref:O-antigen ligase family protein n=1 Tax=Bosea sp. (strain PAMC 26642) TaxID=1792307 RepID=UPI00076FE935|nr:O-antigen ligase family protein [Bosea sp. PAMC 26642]AMJ62548.1 hypothetical protein AXW83_21560 [Bosea sp. PAMC 26642]